MQDLRNFLRRYLHRRRHSARKPFSMHLKHVHLPQISIYTRSANLQARLVDSHLRYKATSFHDRTFQAPPDPTLLTFETTPTYTCGRREIRDLTRDQVDYLRADGKADFFPALRGGQTTFHGPGQLTGYLILSLDRHSLSPRSYVRFLEDSVIRTCFEYGITAFTTQHPGFWISDDEKIASVGVHLRRNVTSHGVGLNVSTDLSWFERIVVCGLPEKRTVTFESLHARAYRVDEVADVLAKSMAVHLKGVGGLQQCKEQDIQIAH